MDPVAYLEERYVTGDYFTRVYDEWAKEWTAKHGAAGAHVLVSAKEYAETMKKNVAKNPLTMLDIFLIHLHPQDFDKLSNYGPGGKTLKEMYANLAELASKGGDLAYEGLGRLWNLATIDTPNTAHRLYEYYKSEFVKMGVTEENVRTWVNNFIDTVKNQQKEIRDGTREKFEFVSDSPIWQLLASNFGIYAEKVGEKYYLGKEWIKEVIKIMADTNKIGNVPPIVSATPTPSSAIPPSSPSSPNSPTPAIPPSAPNATPEPAIPPSQPNPASQPSVAPSTQPAILPSTPNVAPTTMPQPAIPPSSTNTASQPSPNAPNAGPQPAVPPSPSSPQNPQPGVRNPFRGSGS
jgi:hypothetical protein